MINYQHLLESEGYAAQYRDARRDHEVACRQCPQRPPCFQRWLRETCEELELLEECVDCGADIVFGTDCKECE